VFPPPKTQIVNILEHINVTSETVINDANIEDVQDIIKQTASDANNQNIGYHN
jgi:hypothetical protein